MNETTKQQVKARLATVEGHIRGIQRMADEDAYCVDIIKQILAVQRALDKVSTIVLSGHLDTCVTNAIRAEDPEARERVLTELLDVFEMSKKI